MLGLFAGCSASSPSSGGDSGSTGEGGSGGAATGGTTGSGGAATGGSSALGGGDSGSASCGSTSNQYPFGCHFAWGTNAGGAVSQYTYLQFVSNWVGSEVAADGSISSCDACDWLTGRVAKTNLVPVYYAYFIGFYGHANGLADGNQNPGGANLTTGGAALIKANRAKVIAMYAWYAAETYKVWASKPLVWLLEGDFVQYAGSSQTGPLTYAELGQLAADITCAIKSNMPNAVVAIDHSSWNADAVTKSYWGAMAAANYDMVWTTGVGDNNGFLDAKATGTSYNHATATYAYLHTLTKRTILVDTSFGLSAAGDSWSSSTVANINLRIADGVVAANVITMPSGFEQNVTTMSPSLDPVTTCP
jgi:hypothetical protein